MVATKTEFPPVEGVLLLRQDGKTVAIHLTMMTATLEAIVSDYPRGGSVLDHYAVEAHGAADRLFLWTGPDPFAKPAVEASRAEVEA